MCPRNKDLEEPRGGSAPGREAGSPAAARRAALLWGGRSGARRGSTSVRGRGPGSAPASALLCESRGSRCSRRRIGLPGVEARGPPPRAGSAPPVAVRAPSRAALGLWFREGASVLGDPAGGGTEGRPRPAARALGLGQSRAGTRISPGCPPFACPPPRSALPPLPLPPVV